MQYARWICVICALLALSACKIRIIAPESGGVITESGAYTCNSGSTCNIDVVDFFFNETFVAEPLNGYEFRFWRRADRRFCGRDTEPCTVFTEGLDAFDNLAMVIEPFLISEEEIFFLEPVFRSTGIILLPMTQDNMQGQWDGEAAITSPTLPGLACRWDIRVEIDGSEALINANLTFDNTPLICESFQARGEVRFGINGTQMVVSIVQGSDDLLGPDVLSFLVSEDGSELVSELNFFAEGAEVVQTLTFGRP
ncbi:MAG: hypothetical protein AAF699_18210 [Pseudomonadota bacterium]